MFNEFQNIKQLIGMECKYSTLNWLHEINLVHELRCLLKGEEERGWGNVNMMKWISMKHQVYHGFLMLQDKTFQFMNGENFCSGKRQLH